MPAEVIRTPPHVDAAPAAPPGPPPPSPAAAALAWSFANTAVSRLATLAIGVLLARLLGPHEFGTYAIAFVALMAVLSFNELGVSLAIVRWRTDPAAIVGTVTTVSLLASALLTLLGVVSAPAFAAAMGDPEAAPVVQLLSLSVLISGAVATPAALMQRHFQQRRRMLIDQAGVWVGAVSSVVLALSGAGAMSLAFGRVAGSLVAAGLFLKLSPLPYRLAWDRSVLPPLLRFGLPLAGASLVVFAVSYADQLVVGRLLGVTALGYYVLAYNLASWPVIIFSQPLRSVAPAAFARMQDSPEVMRGALLCVLGLLAAVAFPVCALFAGSAVALIGLVYGPEWGPAAAVLPWLAAAAALKIVCELAYDYLVIVGASFAILYMQVASFTALVPAVLVGASEAGVAGAGAAQLAVVCLVVLPLYAVQFRRAGLSTGALARRLARPVFAAGVVGVGGFLADRSLTSDVRSLLLSAALATASTCFLLFLQRHELRRLRELVACTDPSQLREAGE